MIVYPGKLVEFFCGAKETCGAFLWNAEEFETISLLRFVFGFGGGGAGTITDPCRLFPPPGTFKDASKNGVGGGGDGGGGGSTANGGVDGAEFQSNGG